MVPVPNAAAERTQLPDGRLQLSVPLNRPAWVFWLAWWLPISKERRVELDRTGVATFALLDGTRTLAAVIDIHEKRWKLSPLEARAMILDYLRPLVRAGLVALVEPK